MDPDYCVLYQELHKMTNTCLRAVLCKECGTRGHTKIDCPLTKTLLAPVLISEGRRERVKPSTGGSECWQILKSFKIVCPQIKASAVPLHPSMGSHERVELDTRTPEGGGSIQSFRFDPQDKEDFLRSKRKRKSCNISKEVELSTACGKSYHSEVIYVSFTVDVPEMEDITNVEDTRRPLKSRRMRARVLPDSCESHVEDVIDLLVSSGDETEENTEDNTTLKIFDIISGEDMSFHQEPEAKKREQVTTVIQLSSDEESEGKEEMTCQRDKCGDLHHKERHSITVQDEAGVAKSSASIEKKLRKLIPPPNESVEMDSLQRSVCKYRNFHLKLKMNILSQFR